MHFQGDNIVFDACDLHFVKRFGALEAAEMVGDFYADHDFAFLYDTYQLSAFLHIPRDRLFALSRNPENAYCAVTIPKKGGGVRTLHVPYKGGLSLIQRRIARLILSHMPVSQYATAYRHGRSVRDNASPHCGKRYLLKMDIRDFFGSIRFDQVYRAAFHTGHFPKQIGAMLTSLCCYQERLPQGAPSSPALSNLVMKHFDEAMGRWCSKRGVSYTRYSDDLTFSADVPLYGVYIKAKSFLENMGFELNEKKTRFLTNGTKQIVTGLVVNESKPTVSRESRRALRQELYYVEKFGVADAILRGERTAFIENGIPQTYRYLDHLEGRVRYVLHIMKQDAYFKKACAMLHRLRHELPLDHGYTSFF